PHLEGRIRKDQESLDQFITDELNFLMETGNAGTQGRVHDIIIRRVEKPLIEAVLRITNGNKKKAAQILGINRNTLSKKMEELGLEGKEND
ncbi:MAG: hypothetical protein L0213_04005, partial [Candidatus Dadabacteria bacterium]|nr:hypothetical protein [Candidatus Dadabacteria bacterium]